MHPRNPDPPTNTSIIPRFSPAHEPSPHPHLNLPSRTSDHQFHGRISLLPHMEQRRVEVDWHQTEPDV